MHSGLRIGRIFGIDIRIDRSWFLIFFLVVWSLAMVFGGSHPEWSTGLRWSTAVIAAILFFASVLGHELAHSLVARAQGISIHGITLFLFGGVSNIGRDPDSPRGEFVMAIVGPITSFVLGGLFMWLAALSAGPLTEIVADPTAAISRLHALSMLLMWLGSINVLLGFFNLMPGFPLDGGRVLRAILWAATDNLLRATRWASWAGQGVAWLMIVTGIAMVFGMRIPFFGRGLVSGLWVAFIGWFSNGASVQSYRQVVMQDALQAVPVARMMRSSPPTVPAKASVASLVHDHVMGTGHRAFPVLDDGRLAGLVTLEDVRAVSRETWDSTAVREIMTPFGDLVVATPEEEAAEAMKKLMGRDVAQLPVLRDGKLAGLLHRGDIVNWLALYSGLEAS